MDRGTGAIRRRAAVVLAGLTASGLLAIAVPGQAQAVSADSCEGRKIRTFTFSTGSVKLYKDGGWLCAMTFPKSTGGGKRTMMVSIQARGFGAVVDKGKYTHHAGPVKTYAGTRKVWIKGQVGRGTYESSSWKRY
ncbi:hypothetical protein [Streptomyces justiciae]|uniref:Secreted protein n=1 Tax=Streptomyces justiciae TaxID=2780140 RepID=A0ABU3M3T2_9ACTN|nr:hypothetical protein [Streptomyces justiciae]MBE8469626.1 hypothetical protein [Streptomyces justiciae]MCW8384283.1 hypothetical protein [Streptomyces justiciae]MDT7846162.1 hypothetical protein [Streptomyces justiciae]